METALFAITGLVAFVAGLAAAYGLQAWRPRLPPVRREEAETYLLVVLVAFAITVIATRWFLALTGWPRAEFGGYHVAHVLWGGLLMAIGAIALLLFIGRIILTLSAGATGAGIGLFIDEVGKFITTSNDYFADVALPIIYATFLITVLVYLYARRPDPHDTRSQLLYVLEDLEEAVEGDLQPGEREAILRKLRLVMDKPESGTRGELARLLNEFILAGGDRYLAPERRSIWSPAVAWWRTQRERLSHARSIRIALVVALAMVGAVTLGRFVLVALAIVQLVPGLLEPREGTLLWPVVQLVVEAVSGALLLAGAVFLAMGNVRRGARLAYIGLLVALTLGDLLAFYTGQFDSIFIALLHFALLLGVIGYHPAVADRRLEGRAAGL